jgi:mono/diheme cytochrome c family protein
VCFGWFALLILSLVNAQAAQNPPQPQGQPGPPDKQTEQKYPDGEKIWTTVPIHTMVLPKDATVQQLADTMRDWKAAIGGHCVTCHTISTDPRNLNAMGHAEIMPYDSALPVYKASMRMYLMTREMNKEYMPTAKEPVVCSTCHRGHLLPPAYIVPEGRDAQMSMPPVFVPSKLLTPEQQKAAEQGHRP